MPRKIGITGGIGSGKSLVAKVLRLLGIPVYDCDIRARQLMLSDANIRKDLIALLGNDVYSTDGQLNRELLARYLFSSEEHTLQINAIVHPKVREDFYQWAEKRSGKRVIALETAILYEALMENDVDKVWLVTAPLPLRIGRAVCRDASTPEKIRARIARQMPQELLELRADTILRNDGQTALLPQILHALKELEPDCMQETIS